MKTKQNGKSGQGGRANGAALKCRVRVRSFGIAAL
jgi:hypothetical protein